MKKLAVALLGIMLCQSALASSKLPFVGERSFNFLGGNATQEVITISKSGNVVIIGETMTGEPYTVYKGRYKPLMCFKGYDFCYKIIGKDKIAVTDTKGRIEKGGCFNFDGTEKKCIVPLEK